MSLCTVSVEFLVLSCSETAEPFTEEGVTINSWRTDKALPADSGKIRRWGTIILIFHLFILQNTALDNLENEC